MLLQNAERIRVVFFGTPAYAVPALEALHHMPEIDLRLVVTQPDRPAGRGRVLTPPPVKVAALGLHYPLYQPVSLRTPADREPLVDTRADVFVVAAYGKILGPRLLSIPSFGSINLHASLLPTLRGASPIAASILLGDSETGVTLMLMDEGLDTGPVLAQRALTIETTDTTVSLTARLSELGAHLLADELLPIIHGKIRPVPQDDMDATMTRPLVKADGWVDWSRTAGEIERHVRAMWDWPRAWTTAGDTTVQIHSARATDAVSNLNPGMLRETTEGVVVGTGAGDLVLERIQLPGGRPIDVETWARQVDLSALRLGASGRPIHDLGPIVRRVRP